MGLRVRAVVLFEFQCPKCKGWYPESNPLECPHQNGRGVKYKPAKGDKIINIATVLRKLGLEEKSDKIVPVKTQSLPERHLKPPVPVQTSAPVGVTLDDMLKAECPKSG